MRILLVNDDGINAEGINVLKKILDVDHEIIVFAPEGERSATGHGISLRKEITYKKISDSNYSCSGLPADCVFLALNHFFKDNLPDLVISGINRGPNLGQDVYYSGTVAGAREANFNNIPSLAVSLTVDFWKENPVCHFEFAANFVKDLLEKDILKRIPEHTLLNINVPNISEDKILRPLITKIGLRDYAPRVTVNGDKVKISGVYQGFTHADESDCEAVENNHISITALNFLKVDSNANINIDDLLS